MNVNQAAAVFNINLPEWLADDVQVGTIAGVKVYAGEVRRLTKALAESSESDPNDNQILEFLRRRQLIEAIKYRRQISVDGLKEAKEYVEAIGVRHGLRKVTEVSDYSWPHTSRPIHAWVD